MENLDELIERMQRDENLDAEYSTPINYAKAHGMYPQGIYKAIRDERLKTYPCLCGKRVIKNSEADELFKKNKSVEELKSIVEAEDASEDTEVKTPVEVSSEEGSVNATDDEQDTDHKKVPRKKVTQIDQGRKPRQPRRTNK